MSKIVGYMITWTTYGSWLQGDKRRFVKDGRILEGDEKIHRICERLQKGQSIKLKSSEKSIVRTAILTEAERIGQQIEAVAVCTNHIHLAARPSNKSIERIVSMYKSAATRQLRFCDRTGRIWTKGFDKRFCFDEEDFQRKVLYIKRHR